MHSISFTEARGQLTEIANHVQYKHETWVLTKNKKPALALVPIEALKILEQVREAQEDAEDVQAVSEYRSKKNAPTLPLEGVLKKLNL